jgi:Haem-binding domain
MMQRIKKILMAMLIVFIVVQFIQPERNENRKELPADISKLVSIPDSVKVILKNACYDCHSNSTIHPWYANIQPMGWLMAYHVTQGKLVLNFSEFGNYSARRQINKLKGIANSIKDGTMPLSSYKWMHKNARLTQNEKTLIIHWVEQSKDNLFKNQ